MSPDPIATYRTAVERVPAYRDFLNRERGRIPLVETMADFESLPCMDKQSYLRRYPVQQLCLDGSLRGAHFISRSSGSSSEPLYWPRVPSQERDLPDALACELEETIALGQRRTLAIVSLALGGWIAGELFSWTLRTLAMRHGNLTLATPGMDREEVVHLLKTFSPLFDQTLLYGYPPHVKSSIESAVALGVPVRNLHLKLGLAGEGYTEKYREQMNGLLGYAPGEISSISSGYGSTDFGWISDETPLSITLRRILHERELGPRILGCAVLPSICQYDPARLYIELQDGELVVTKAQPVPLIRFRSGDLGDLVACDEMLARFRAAGIDPLEELRLRGGDPTKAATLPFILVHGRSDGGVVFSGANILVGQVRDALENDPPFPDLFTGSFQLRLDQDDNLDPVLKIYLEEKEPVQDAAALSAPLARALARRSKEYAISLDLFGEKAHPVIIPVGRDGLMPGGKIRYVQGGPPSAKAPR